MFIGGLNWETTDGTTIYLRISADTLKNRCEHILNNLEKSPNAPSCAKIKLVDLEVSDFSLSKIQNV